MSRAIDDGQAVAIDRPGNFLRLAAMFVVLGLTAGARADEPPAGFRVGQRVVSRSDDLTLDGEGVWIVPPRNRVFRVEQVDGTRLRLRAEGEDSSGWAPADKVVPFGPPADPAVRRAGARQPGGFGSVVAAPFRHRKSSAALRQVPAEFNKRDYDSVIAECTEAIRLEPYRADAFFFRGTALLSKNRPDEALTDLTEAIQLGPRAAMAFSNRGGAWLQKREPDKALADCNEALRLDPSEAMAYANRGAAWTMKNEPDKALANCNEAIRLDPHLARAFNNRGAAWLQKGELDKALADLDEAIRLEPRDADALVNRARVWESRGQYDKAIADLKVRASLASTDPHRLYPQLAEALNNRGSAWLRKKELDKVLADLNRTLRLEPRDYDALGNRARVWEARGEPDKALADLKAIANLATADRLSHQPTCILYADGPVREGAGRDGNVVGQPGNKGRPDPPNVVNVDGHAGSQSAPAPTRPRDGQAAVAEATRACELTEWKGADEIDSLAAAQVEAGNLDAAAKHREIAAATWMCSQREWKDPGRLGILASACADAGHFDLAVKWQTQANALHTEGNARSDGEARLKLYQAKQLRRKHSTRVSRSTGKQAVLLTRNPCFVAFVAFCKSPNSRTEGNEGNEEDVADTRTPKVVKCQDNPADLLRTPYRVTTS